ncbi:MAG: precorrin-2 C(20)-methyltransferase [Halobacteriota archaeon]
MSLSKLYGIGVGPGEPELITLKAYRILREVEMIVAPKSRAGKRSLALLTVERIIKERENELIVVEPVFPMTKDQAKLDFYWGKAREEVLEKGKGCETVAFITLGDPSMYSTFYRFLEIFKDVVDEVEVIPGVTSFSACSSIAKVPIAEGNEIVSIVPEANDKSAEVIGRSDTVVFLKPKNVERIKKMLAGSKAILGIKIGFEDQELVLGNLDAIDVPDHYLATLIVKKEEEE